MSKDRYTDVPPIRIASPGLKKSLITLALCSADTLANCNAPESKLVAQLANKTKIAEDEIVTKLAHSLGLEEIDLSQSNLIKTIRTNGLLNDLEASFLLSHRCLPIERRGNSIVLAMADPLDMETIADISYRAQCNIQPAIAKELEIILAINKLLSIKEIEGLDVCPERHTENSVSGQSDDDDQLSDEVGSQTAPVIRFVNQILQDAAVSRASDIHLTPGPLALEVSYRVDGVMLPQLSIPKRLQSFVIARIKILSGMDITERRRPQDGRFRIKMREAESLDIRSSSVPTQFGEKLVLRLLAAELGELSLAHLNLPQTVEAGLREALKSRDRIILVTGPTGSGKTTTLYSALNELLNIHLNIITVEDPVEIRVPGITQIQVDQKTNMTFASGLRSILRQDPDVILVGEIRDLETAEIAFQAAQTGHLVLSTLHTNTAASAVVRLLDLGLEPFIIASSLGAVLAQRLVRKICTRCAVQERDEKILAQAISYNIPCANLKKGLGCKHCDSTGFKGRTGVYSLLPVNKAIRDLIRAQASEEKISHLAKTYGMQTLFQSGLELVSGGITTLDEVVRVLGADEQLTTPSVARESQAVDIAVADLSQAERRPLSELVDDYHTGRAHVTSREQKKILLVDDDDGVRAVMSRILKKANFDVCEAGSGHDALSKLEQFTPDLIVSDLVMPGMSGRELVSALKKKTDLGKIPILMLTGSDSEENEIELLGMGAQDFVSKTASPALVVMRVRKLAGC